jgi:hypothetical protein
MVFFSKPEKCISYGIFGTGMIDIEDGIVVDVSVRFGKMTGK